MAGTEYEGISGSSLWHRVGATSTDATSTAVWSRDDVYTFSTGNVEASASVKRGPQYEKGVDVNLFFRFLKSRLTTIELKFVKERLEQLEKMADEFAELGQEAAQDECLRQFLILMKEAEIQACGFDLFLTKEHIDKLQNMKVKGSHYMKITPLKNFGRILPGKVAAVVKSCLEKRLFDEYVVCHCDDKEAIDTEDERIEKKKAKERDPVMFGRVEHSDKYYFIADWIDEYDTLQLKDLVKALSLKKAEMKLPKKIKPLDFKQIIKDS